MTSPFRKAETVQRKLKLFLYGEAGAGKTTLSLQFPDAAVIDLERGADLYGDAFRFDVLKAATADEVSSAVSWLLANEHPYQTLVIDPITVYWESLQQKWSEIFLRRNSDSKGHRGEFYNFQPRDWMTIKAEVKELVRKLIALDLHVVVTARIKPKYGPGDNAQIIGETFDGEKSLPYLFDTILKLRRDGKGRVFAENIKDRTNKLPKGEFDCSYEVLQDRLGREALSRSTEPKPRRAPAASPTAAEKIGITEKDMHF
jgi:hypothetical protein